jgi:alpha-ketoglutarate-dependent taurine dioxygenase
MKISKIPGLGRFGIFIDDVNLETISEDQWLEIGHLHLKSLVTIIRDAHCSKEKYPELMAKFGDVRPPTYTARKYKKKYKKDWTWVVDQAKNDSKLIDEDDRWRIKVAESVTERTTNGHVFAKIAGGYDDQGHPNGFFSDGELLWHSNESGTLTSCPGVSLMGWENMIGSSTGFITTVDYYESVSERFRSELDDMIILHRYTPGKIAPGNDPLQDKLLSSNMCPEDDTEVPLVISSPGGFTGLHYSINTVHSIKGATSKESQQIFEAINKELFIEKYTYDHWYHSNNDICLFDNSITLHRRLGYIDGRLAYRIPFDYTYLQNEPWQPYRQSFYQRRYNKEINEVVKTAGINFKFPSYGLLDRIKNLFD